jgi:general secretion pathway protein C
MAAGMAKPLNWGRVGLDRLILLAELVLAGLLVFLLFKISFIFIKPSGSQVIAPANPDIDGPVSISAVDNSILSQFDPFHRERTGPAIIATEIAPETTLDLKVYGMRADLKGDSSSAIIETPDNKQATYFVGDEIISGVTLKSVDIDFVILDRNGTSERLSRQGRTEDEKAAGSTVALSALSFEAASMIKDVRFYPHREGRKVIGYRVLPQRGADSTLEKYGFERGDVITSINGEDLTQQQVNLPNLWKNLRQSRYANIQIIRNDVPMTIEVNLQ